MLASLFTSRVYLLRLPRGLLSVFDQLCLEEALFRSDTRTWVLLAEGAARAPPTLVLGVSGALDELVHRGAAAAAGALAIRRFTGGGTVVTDGGTLFASVIANRRDCAGAPLFPREVMRWSTGLYGPALDALTDAARGGSGARFALSEHDYCLGDRKVGGNAQAVSRERWVHHTSFLWDAAPENLALLKLPAKRPEYRRDRPHDAFVTRLREHAPPGAAPGAFFAAVEARLRDAARGDEGRVVEASLDDALAALPRNERRGNAFLQL